jgi:integrase/recombinase XerD
MSTSSFQSLIQHFFTDRLITQLGLSPGTIAAYRDSFRLLLKFASARLRKTPSKLLIEDLDVAFLVQFLDWHCTASGSWRFHQSDVSMDPWSI